MDYVIWGGATLTLLGVLALIWCIVLAMRVRKAHLPDDQAKAALQRVVTLNIAALALSFLGLMAVITGILLS